MLGQFAHDIDLVFSFLINLFPRDTPRKERHRLYVSDVSARRGFFLVQKGGGKILISIMASNGLSDRVLSV